MPKSDQCAVLGLLKLGYIRSGDCGQHLSTENSLSLITEETSLR